MPIYQYSCKKDHEITEYFTSYKDAPEKRKCNAILEDNKICNLIANKVPSVCAAIFAPYQFAADGYASHSDRERLFNNPNKEAHLGTANKESMTKNPSRKFERYHGSQVKRIATIK